MWLKQVVVITKLSPKDLRPQTRGFHRQTLKKVLRCLDKLSLSYRVLDRSRLQKKIAADLVIAVGGDGTALAASHYADTAPHFGINSAPQTSTGFFCVASPHNFERYLQRILSGKLKPKVLPRLEVFLNRKKLRPYGLNEVLFASMWQGETARYTLCIGKKREDQKSSGVWIATGAGSSGAIYSAGGKKVSPYSPQLQYFVREACRFPKNHYRLLKGFLKKGEEVKIVSQMGAGMIFIDGGRWRYRVRQKEVITVRGNVAPLKIFLAK